MIANALIVTIVCLMAFGFYVLDAVAYLRTYRDMLLSDHGRLILVYAALLAANIFAGALLLFRKLGLQDTGRKLRHFTDERSQDKALATLLERR
jgi:hypothetical protein